MAITKVKSEGKFGKLARTFSRNRKIQVRLQGTGCYTDNEKLINLPANADWLSDATQHLLEGCLDHEVGHCERQQFGQEQRIRGETWNGKLFPLYTEEARKMRSVKERNLLNVFEDISLEINASKRWIGTHDNLRELNETLTKRLSASASKLSPWKALTIGIIGTARGFDTSWLPAEVKPIIAALAPVLAKARVETEHVGYSVRRVYETLDIIKEFAEKQPNEKDDHADDKEDAEEGTPEEGSKEEQEGGEEGTAGGEEEEGEEGEEGEEHGAGEQSEEGEEEAGEEGSSGEGEEGEEEGGESEGEGGEEEGGEESEEEGGEGSSSDEKGDDRDAGEEEQKPSEDEPTQGSRDFAKQLDEEDSDIEHVTDEINKQIEGEAKREMSMNKRHYPHPAALAKDRIGPVEIPHYLPEPAETTYQNLLKEIAPVVSGLRSRLMQYLRGMKNESITGDQERGYIDDQALYGLRTGDKRVFYTRTETEDDGTAIGILVDMSGSMMGGGGGGKIHVAKQSCIAVSECLAKLGLPFAVWGFHNKSDVSPYPSAADQQLYNRFRSLDIDIFKGFEENFAKVRSKITYMQAGGDNTDGEAVQWAINQLRARPERRKILMVLSDGNPLSGSSDETVLRQHLKEEVARGMKVGVEVFGIGIMTDVVKHFYPDYTVVNSLPELPKAMFGMLRKYLMRPAKVRTV